MKQNRIDDEVLAVGLIAFVLNTAVAYLLAFHFNVFMVDALARTASAVAVFFSREPKLANIGFDWVPLSALLQLPFVLIPQFRNNAFSGDVVTIFAGTGTAMLLAILLRRAQVPRPVRWFILAAFLLNPMILFYSANGMSEMTHIFFVLLSIAIYWRWRETMHWTDLASAGTAIGLALMTRYDALLVVVAMAVIIGLHGILRHPDDPRFAESSIWMFVAPAAYMLLLWLLVSWAIQGDPLYFAHSRGSNAARLSFDLADRLWILPLKGNFGASVRATLSQVWEIFPAFIIVSVILLFVIFARRDWPWLGTLVVGWSPLAIHAINVYRGESTMQLRYFFAAVPMSFLLAAAVLMAFPRWRTAVGFALVIVLGVSSVSTIQAMRQTPDWGYVHRSFLDALSTGRVNDSYDPELQMAQYVRDKTTGRVLVDDFEGNRIILFSGQPVRFIITSDSTFKRTVSEPFGRADFVLVFNPAQRAGQAGSFELINRTYPELYNQGGEWVQLDQAIGDWKLYRIVGIPGAVPLVNPAEQVSRP